MFIIQTNFNKILFGSGKLAKQILQSRRATKTLDNHRENRKLNREIRPIKFVAFCSYLLALCNRTVSSYAVVC